MKLKRLAKQSRRGAASISLVVVLIMAELAILSIVLAGSRDQDLSVARVNSLQAFYAAEAGINMAIRETIDDTDHDGDGQVGGIASTADTLAALHNASVAVASTVNGSTVTLVSLGERSTARHRFETSLDVSTSSSSIEWLYGVAVSANVRLTGNSRIDAFDSTSGNYSMWTNYSNPATVATNATGSDEVHLEGSSRIVGDVSVGPGGNHVTVIEEDGTAWITGTRDALADAVTPPSISVPDSLPLSQGNTSFPTWGSGALSAGTYRYNNFSVTNSYTLYINGDVTIYCDGNFTLTNSGTVNLASGATLTVYAQRFQFTGNSRLNMTNPATPSRVLLNHMGTDSFRVDNSAAVAAAVLAPDARVWVPNNGRLFGVVQADNIMLENSGKFTQDIGFSAMTGGGSSTGGTTVAITDWNAVAPQ